MYIKTVFITDFPNPLQYVAQTILSKACIITKNIVILY